MDPEAAAIFEAQNERSFSELAVKQYFDDYSCLEEANEDESMDICVFKHENQALTDISATHLHNSVLTDEATNAKSAHSTENGAAVEEADASVLLDENTAVTKPKVDESVETVVDGPDLKAESSSVLSDEDVIVTTRVPLGCGNATNFIDGQGEGLDDSKASSCGDLESCRRKAEEKLARPGRFKHEMGVLTKDSKPLTDEVPFTLAIRKDTVVETRTSAEPDETAVDVSGFAIRDSAAGGREYFGSCQQRKTLAGLLERGMKGLTEAENERKRERNAFVDVNQGLEEVDRNVQVKRDALQEEHACFTRSMTVSGEEISSARGEFEERRREWIPFTDEILKPEDEAPSIQTRLDVLQQENAVVLDAFGILKMSTPSKVASTRVTGGIQAQLEAHGILDVSAYIPGFKVESTTAKYEEIKLQNAMGEKRVLTHQREDIVTLVHSQLLSSFMEEFNRHIAEENFDRFEPNRWELHLHILERERIKFTHDEEIEEEFTIIGIKRVKREGIGDDEVHCCVVHDENERKHVFLRGKTVALGYWGASFSRGRNVAMMNDEGMKARAEERVECEGEYMGAMQEAKLIPTRSTLFPRVRSDLGNPTIWISEDQPVIAFKLREFYARTKYSLKVDTRFVVAKRSRHHFLVDVGLAVDLVQIFARRGKSYILKTFILELQVVNCDNQRLEGEYWNMLRHSSVYGRSGPAVPYPARNTIRRLTSSCSHFVVLR
jgi:hypothetical protein